MSRRASSSGVIVTFLLLTGSMYCTCFAADRTSTGEAIAATADVAEHGAYVLAVKAAARDLTQRVYKNAYAEVLLEHWDELGLEKFTTRTVRLDDGTFRVTAEIHVDADELRAVMVKYPPQSDGPPKGTVVVIVPEQILRLPAPDPAAETAIRQAFTTAGYEVVDQTVLDFNKKRDIVRALRRVDAAAAQAIHEQFAADIIVYGEAFAEEVRGGGQYLPNRFTATCEIHAVTADTAREVGGGTGTGANEAETPLQAGKLALKSAGAKVASSVIKMMEATTPRLAVTVIVNGVAYFNTSQDISATLKKLAGPEGVGRPRLDLQNKTCSWDVRSGLTAEAIAAGLQAGDRPRMRIIEATGQKVVAEVVD